MPEAHAGVIGEKLQAALKKADLSLNAAAKLIGTRPSTLQYWWEGRSKEEYLPAGKPWAQKLRRELMARGLSSDQVDELFGHTYGQLISLSRRVDEVERTVATINTNVSAILKILEKPSIRNTPQRSTVKP